MTSNQAESNGNPPSPETRLEGLRNQFLDLDSRLRELSTSRGTQVLAIASFILTSLVLVFGEGLWTQRINNPNVIKWQFPSREALDSMENSCTVSNEGNTNANDLLIRIEIIGGGVFEEITADVLYNDINLLNGGEGFSFAIFSLERLPNGTQLRITTRASQPIDFVCRVNDGIREITEPPPTLNLRWADYGLILLIHLLSNSILYLIMTRRLLERTNA